MSDIIICTSCGFKGSLIELRARFPKAASCCPERKTTTLGEIQNKDAQIAELRERCDSIARAGVREIDKLKAAVASAVLDCQMAKATMNAGGDYEAWLDNAIATLEAAKGGEGGMSA